MRVRDVPGLKSVLYTVLFYLKNTVYDAGFCCFGLMFGSRAATHGSLKA
jgi:hypothetical protein